MNKVELIGRLTRDPEVKYGGANNTAVAHFTLAVDKKFKKEGEATADFINCVAFGKTAELIEKYIFKGSQIGIEGRIQTGSYTNKDNQKVYTTDIAVESIDFCGSSNKNSNSTPEQNKNQSDDGFMNIPEGIEEELPFN